jgi:hypothetical protein
MGTSQMKVRRAKRGSVYHGLKDLRAHPYNTPAIQASQKAIFL